MGIDHTKLIYHRKGRPGYAHQGLIQAASPPSKLPVSCAIGASMADHLDALFDCLRFPSVSTDSSHAPDVRACADWLHARLNAMGMKAEIHETPRHPVVLAKGPQKEGRPHVLLYGHYDVQPADPIDLWSSDPFQPEIRDGVIYARGATDNKGQFMAHLMGIEQTLASHGDLPVNLTVLLEGEEEIGSPNLDPFLEKHRADLACDVVAVSDTGMVAAGLGTLTYGLRGIACLEFTVTGPSADLHSGVWGGAVANPATAAAALVASLHDENRAVAIDGFYDDVCPLEKWEREAWAALPGGEDETLALTGAPALSGEAGFSELEHRWGRPTAEVNGIWGGYQGEGSKTIVPSKASVKLSFRLVPDQDPADILGKAKTHLEKHLPAGITLEIEDGHAGKSYLMDPHSPYGKAAQRALVTTFGGEPALIREGGSIPIVQSFKDILEADTLLLGLALPDCQIHSPNENFPVASYEAGIRLNVELLKAIAEG